MHVTSKDVVVSYPELHALWIQDWIETTWMIGKNFK
jgi:hypothetical protein